MTQEEKRDIQERINNKMSDLKERIDEYKELTKPIPPSEAIGRVSRMDAINNRSVNEAALIQLKNQVQGLENALKRLGEDKFGRCISCGEKIPIGRIIIMPGAIRCVRCS
ncbi:MAG: TraR/DksA family transcriptional regulator [Crocinitomicaceae bacterium]|nr:TraR/DksA family transcriptional regulator [Crocinitomicaceae bacterium]